MAVTQNSYTGTGSQTTFSFTFPYLKASDIKASLDAVDTTAFTLPTATTLQFNTAPANGVKIKIFRETATDNLTATFYAGSAIKSEDLNENFTQNLYSTQEVGARYLSNLGGTMVGNFGLGEDADIVFEGASDNANETTITVADPTADRTITFPNVSGNVVTTGDTGTVTSTMLADGTIVAADLASDAVTTAKITDGNVTTAKLGADAVTGAKIADDQINSEHYVDASIDTAHIADSQITNAKMADNSVNTAELVDDAVTAAKLASNSVVSASIVDGTIVTGDIANNAITNAKMADDSVGAAELVDTSVGTAALASNAVTNAKMADNAVGTSELVNDSVTTVKIANSQVTTAKIADSNVTTAKINNDAVTSAKIVDNAVGNEHLQDDSVRTAEIQASAVTTAKIADDAVTGAKIADGAVVRATITDGEVISAKLDSNSVTTSKINNNSVTADKIASNAVTTDKIADAELTTLSGMQSGTASVLASSTALTATTTEINQLDGKTIQTTVADNDAQLPTSGAIVDYVAAQIAPLGGLEVIATEVAFPNTQPASGVVISISDAGGIVVNGSGVSTTGRTVGGSTVTINGFPSSVQSSTLAASMGLMVSSTGSSQTYTYHKLLGKESDIVTLSDDINDFNNRYRVSGSAPTSSLDNGDLWFDTTNGKMMVYNSSASAWEEVSAIGSFNINTLSSSGSTGGGSATFNGTAYRFTLSNPPQDAQQLLVSINGVVQKPNSGSSQPSEGFAISGNDIIFSAAPASGSISFIITLGQSVQIGTPSDNTISTAKIQNLAVTGDKVATNLDLADNKKIRFGTGNDLQIFHDGSHSRINNTTGYLTYNGQFGHLFRNGDGSESFIRAHSNGAVELYYDNSKKFETTSSGTKVTGQELIYQGASGGTANTGAGLTLEDDNHHYLQFLSPNNKEVGILFGDDADNNVGYIAYSHSTNALAIGTNAGERVKIDSSGKVGINEVNPVEMLHIKAEDNTDGFGGLAIYANNNSINCKYGWLGPDASNSFRIGVAGSERMRVASDGNVGIGTTSPTQTLDVTASNGVGIAEFTNTATSFSNSCYTVKIDSSAHTSNMTSAGAFAVDVNAGRAMTIDGNGKVGIGTSSPSGTLDVVGSNAVTAEFKSTNGSGGYLAFQMGGSGANIGYLGDSQQLVSTGGAAENLAIRADHALELAVSTTRKVRIDSDGLKFGSDTAAANALDDYEEGTFTCTMTPSSGFTPSANTSTCLYTKIGRQVTVMGIFQMTNPSDLGSYSSGNINYAILISGLPFQIINSTAARSVADIGVGSGLGTSDGILSTHGTANGSSFSIFVNRDNGSVRVSPTLTASNSVAYHFKFIYFTN